MSPINTGALFDITQFLDGRTLASGVFEDRFGRLRRRFEVEMIGAHQGGVFALDERFVYDDGRREERQWIVTQTGLGRFEASCKDCIGVAHGRATIDTISMTYAFRLQLPSRTVAVTFEDRIYRLGPRTAMNRATVRKWGVRLGELSLYFEKQPVAA